MSRLPGCIRAALSAGFIPFTSSGSLSTRSACKVFWKSFPETFDFGAEEGECGQPRLLINRYEDCRKFNKTRSGVLHRQAAVQVGKPRLERSHAIGGLSQGRSKPNDTCKQARQ